MRLGNLSLARVPLLPSLEDWFKEACDKETSDCLELLEMNSNFPSLQDMVDEALATPASASLNEY